jgi:hypothetical protein
MYDYVSNPLNLAEAQAKLESDIARNRPLCRSVSSH